MHIHEKFNYFSINLIGSDTVIRETLTASKSSISTNPTLKLMLKLKALKADEDLNQ